MPKLSVNTLILCISLNKSHPPIPSKNWVYILHKTLKNAKIKCFLKSCRPNFEKPKSLFFSQKYNYPELCFNWHKNALNSALKPTVQPFHCNLYDAFYDF